MDKPHGSILVVDDEFLNRILIRTNLEDQGYQVGEATNGQEALDRLKERSYDVILLDLLMPVLDGFEVLQRIKADPHHRSIPVIIISAMDEMDSLIRCIEMGASDHLPKPFDPVLLRARITTAMTLKRMHDLEAAYQEQIRAERQKAEAMLFSFLPAPISEKLKQDQTSIVERFREATVMFADLAGFTPFVAGATPSEVLNLLDAVFTAFDQLAGRHGLEKIKTIGDAYLVVGGLPVPRPDHLEAAAAMAMDMHRSIGELSASGRIPPFQVRVGIHTGPVVAGVIGRHKPTYDLWGETVNIAARLGSLAAGGSTLVSETVYQMLKGRYLFQEQDQDQIKGQPETKAYRLLGKKETTGGV